MSKKKRKVKKTKVVSLKPRNFVLKNLHLAGTGGAHIKSNKAKRALAKKQWKKEEL
jgi:hypothetical protein